VVLTSMKLQTNILIGIFRNLSSSSKRAYLQSPSGTRCKKILRRRSPERKLVIATHSRHYIQKDDPELVIESIRTVLAQSVHKSPRENPIR
jgi:hypothetical protein